MEVVKAAAERHPGALIIHVEPYIMEWNGERMIPTLDAAMHLQPNEAARAWPLPVEPWIYTVDGNGIVIHSFEGVIGDDELDAAIKEIDADTQLARDMKDRMISSLRAMVPSENNRKVVSELMSDAGYLEKLELLGSGGEVNE